jgi:hypothetical protein
MPLLKTTRGLFAGVSVYGYGRFPGVNQQIGDAIHRRNDYGDAFRTTYMLDRGTNRLSGADCDSSKFIYIDRRLHAFRALVWWLQQAFGRLLRKTGAPSVAAVYDRRTIGIESPRENQLCR